MDRDEKLLWLVNASHFEGCSDEYIANEISDHNPEYTVAVIMEFLED